MSAIVPAVQVLYVIMMYIAIYPIAMSVRATNVYEEKSLGVYEEKDNDDLEDESHWNSTNESRVAIWGKYLVRHVRRQLSFDMWWLALTLFLLCIIERDGLTNPANVAWFNIFALLFELVSAYGTVGLSLGIPTANYSLSGALHTLSKLMLCAVMIRGRHRGLPVALDRAVLFPHEFRRKGREVSNTSATRQEDTAGHDREDSETHDRELPALRARARAETISLHDNERSDAGIGTLITEKMTEVDSSVESSGRHVTVA
ncbi:Low-affinity potassium transport protein [Grifola frondosa]|uniref:Low-affinity potassium transport protein n=1 Tax=Grifola frondosa TaxID=5627 RepID=A0A1C7M2L3_GRIFR|nr:Low-affinity potassium transport protein [Grifola frondosa]